jgi:hypothetical protein
MTHTVDVSEIKITSENIGIDGPSNGLDFQNPKLIKLLTNTVDSFQTKLDIVDTQYLVR